MDNFFTPIEVEVAIANSADLYEVDKYNMDPFQLTPVKIESLHDHRKKIMQWLKSMPISARVDVLTYTNKEFVSLLIRMFQKIQERDERLFQFAISYDTIKGYMLTDERQIREPEKTLLSAEEFLLKSIIVVNRYTRFDSVTVDQNLAADIDQIFALFDVIENGISHQLTQNSYKRYKNAESPLLFYDPNEYQGSTKTLGTWLVEIIKKSISVKYFEQMSQLSSISSNPNPSGDQATKIFYKSKPKQFKKYWKHLDTTKKRNLIDKVFNLDICEIVREYRQIIRVDDRSFPEIKYSHPHHLQAFKKEIIQSNGDNLYNSLTFTKLSEASFELATFKYEILIEIQERIQMDENKITASMKKKNIKIKSPPSKKQAPKSPAASVQNDDKQANQMKNQSSLMGNSGIIIIQKQCSSTGESALQSEGTVKDEEEGGNNEASLMGVNSIKSKRVKKKQNKNKSDSQQGKKTRILSSSSKNKEKEAFQSRSMSQKPNNFEQSDSENEFCSLSKISLPVCAETEKMENEFQKIINEINQRNNTWNKYRNVALNRIGYVLQSYNLSYQIFGSFACGLAIPSSDIDVCIDPTIVHYFYGSFCSYREKIVMALNFLQNCFEQTSWAKKFNLISTASVPVLMFEIDLSIIEGNSKDLILNIPSHNRNKNAKILIDLSIEPFANMTQQVHPHLGYQSTMLVKQWMSHSKLLTAAVITMKFLLSRHSLNKSFTGGISSYTLITLIVSFFFANPQKSINIKEFVTQFISFICSLDFGAHYIDLRHKESPVRQKIEQDKKIIVINAINGRNLTENCNEFDRVVELMQRLSDCLKNVENKSLKEYRKDLRELFF